jgi:hypothetical protein
LDVTISLTGSAGLAAASLVIAAARVGRTTLVRWEPQR